jgi:lipid-binding SYLF domain-containing protein
MKHFLIVVSIAALLAAAFAPAVLAGDSDTDKKKKQNEREKIDIEAQATLERLFKENEGAKQLFDSAYGYAVFDNLKLSFGISGGGGSGVAVQKEPAKRIYMKMGTGGIGFGIGGQKYQVVFFFETQIVFDNFIEFGWSADASANAVALDAGANVQAKFVNGVAVYQLTEAGLMLQADIAGTKYWKNDKLNAPATDEKPDASKEEKETDEE